MSLNLAPGLPLPMPLNHASALPLPMPLNLAPALPLPMPPSLPQQRIFQTPKMETPKKSTPYDFFPVGESRLYWYKQRLYKHAEAEIVENLNT